MIQVLTVYVTCDRCRRCATVELRVQPSSMEEAIAELSHQLQQAVNEKGWEATDDHQICPSCFGEEPCCRELNIPELLTHDDIRKVLLSLPAYRLEWLLTDGGRTWYKSAEGHKWLTQCIHQDHERSND